MDWVSVLREFITLFVVIDPIGSIPVFLFATATVPAGLHTQFAIRAVLAATFILLGFLVGGQLLLDALNLNLGSFEIAGGIVLFLFAMTMVFGQSKPSREIDEAQKDHLSGAIFPLAMPSIASPGAMLAVVILTDNRSTTIEEQAVTAVMLVSVLLITLVALLLASRISRLIGYAGVSIISRVMGIILATVAVDSVIAGFVTLGIIDAIAQTAG